MSTTTLHLIRNVGSYHTGFALAAPVLAIVATPCGQLAYDGPDDTLDGVVCGHCLDNREEIVRHATPAHVWACESQRQEFIAQQAAEIYAENGWLRYAEGGWDTTGAYSYDPYDR